MKLLPNRRRSDEQRTGTMTVMEHLVELRGRVLWCLYALAAGAVVGWFLFDPFMELIRGPFCDFVTEHPDLRPPAGCDLVFSGPLDAMLVKLKVVVFIGLGVALPVILYQLWAFVAPGLTAKEKKWSVPFVVSSFLLFLLGALFAYVTLPKALGFLLGFAGESAVPLITIDRYVGFVTLVTLAFGVSFLFPVLLIFLELVGAVSPDWLASQRRYALLAISIFAAIITPSSDPYSMLGMMIPMYLFYEASIIIGRLLTRDRSSGVGQS
jgi:sec-independent protein translocase protein TatC